MPTHRGRRQVPDPARTRATGPIPCWNNRRVNRQRQYLPDHWAMKARTGGDNCHQTVFFSDVSLNDTYPFLNK